MPTYPLVTLAPSVDLTGISAPTYNDIYQSLIASFQSIYGVGIYIAPDSQDGQWLAILAKAIHESNQAAIAVFQSFSPSYAQGAGLSSLVRLNGLLRTIPTNSSAIGNVVGVAGTIITNGVVQDAANNLWNMPASVTIPIGGLISVSVIAQKTGALVAVSGSINKIYKPQLGWQSFVSTANAVAGAPVESDAQLRTRQSVSTSLPAQAILSGIYSAIGNVVGVTKWAVYENDTGTTDANGIPANSISCVVAGGSTANIAAAIGARKPPGIRTYGTVSGTFYSSVGLPSIINFFSLVSVSIYFQVAIQALPGYVSTTGTLLIQALTDFVNSRTIGDDIWATQAQAAASLIQSPLGQTFYITSFFLGLTPNPVSSANIIIPFSQAAVCSIGNVVLTVI